MKNVQDMNTLRLAIQHLEVQKKEQADVLKLHLNAALESLRPGNIISTTFKQAIKSPDVKNNLLKTGLVLLAGKVIPGGAVMQLLMGNAVNWGADKLTQTNEASGKAPVEIIMEKARGFVGNLFRKKS